MRKTELLEILQSHEGVGSKALRGSYQYLLKTSPYLAGCYLDRFLRRSMVIVVVVTYDSANLRLFFTFRPPYFT
nr:unnamed protein product [Haemonchus contortus]